MTHVLITGGVRSGKSRYAETLFAAESPVTYLTPGYPADPTKDVEWAARVAAHRLRRPPAWRTVETLALAEELRSAEGPVLVDCLGTWVTRLMDEWGAWDEDGNAWAGLLMQQAEGLAEALNAHPHDVALVTNEVGWGVVSEHRSGRLFADNLGRVNQIIADSCDEVVLMVAGRPLRL